MSSRLNTLLHGEALDAAAVLSGDCPPNEQELILELRATLTNAMNRIHLLEERVDSESTRLESQIQNLSERTESWLNRIEESIAERAA